MCAKTVWAADLGGTKLLIGEVDESGCILHERTFPTGYLMQRQAADLLAESLESYRTCDGFEGVPTTLGIGLIGQVNPEKGIWQKIDSARCTPLLLAEELSERFCLPCRLENDVKAATLAEQHFGAGKGVDDFVYVNIGTGIAAGIVCNGRLVRGVGNNAGEVGHVVVEAGSGIPCECGRFGCAEAIASGAGMDRCARYFLPRYPDSCLKTDLENGFVRAEVIFKAAREQDALAQRVTLAALEAISELLMNLVRTTSPERLILGGGVVSDLWFRTALLQRLQVELMKHVELCLSPLDPGRVGLLGAAVTAFNYGKEEINEVDGCSRRACV